MYLESQDDSAQRHCVKICVPNAGDSYANRVLYAQLTSEAHTGLKAAGRPAARLLEFAGIWWADGCSGCGLQRCALGRAR